MEARIRFFWPLSGNESLGIRLLYMPGAFPVFTVNIHYFRSVIHLSGIFNLMFMTSLGLMTVGIQCRGNIWPDAASPRDGRQSLEVSEGKGCFLLK